MKFLRELLPFFTNFIEETYGGGLALTPPEKAETAGELARGFIDGRFISLEKMGDNYIFIITNDKEWLEKELNVEFNEYLIAVQQQIEREENDERIGSN